MQPLLDKAAGIKTITVQLKEALKRLKQDKAPMAQIEAKNACWNSHNPALAGCKGGLTAA